MPPLCSGPGRRWAVAKFLLGAVGGLKGDPLQHRAVQAQIIQFPSAQRGQFIQSFAVHAVTRKAIAKGSNPCQGGCEECATLCACVCHHCHRFIFPSLPRLLCGASCDAYLGLCCGRTIPEMINAAMQQLHRWEGRFSSCYPTVISFPKVNLLGGEFGNAGSSGF